tara:strand:+ start:19341 stop:23894 length:4554 start_codon:yes stop_codon:yes gene_type:complete
MFKLFPIFYDMGAAEESGGGDGGQESSSGENSQKSNENTSSSESSQARQAVSGTGGKYLRVQPYVGNPNQTTMGRMSQSFGSPPPAGSPKHIQLHAGPYMDGGGNSSFIRIYVNEFVVDEDHNTGSLVVNSYFDSVIAICDITNPGSGAPYHTDAQGTVLSGQPEYNFPVGINYDDGFQVKTLSLAFGESLVINSNPATNRFYIEYENNSSALPELGFYREIRVIWSSGDFKDFQVLLPGAAYLDMNGASHQVYMDSTRADSCEGDSALQGGPTLTSESLNYVTYSGNQHSSYIFAGFFEEVIPNGINPLPGNTNFGPNVSEGYFNNTTWNNYRFYDFSYDSNDGPFDFGPVGSPAENVVGEQHYKGIISNLHGNTLVNGLSPEVWLDQNISGNSYQYAESQLTVPIYQAPLQAFNPYMGGGNNFRFSTVHVFAENTPDCTGAPPPPIAFDACIDSGSSDYYGFTYVDCSSTDLTNVNGVNYIANPQLATWNNGACCTDCNNLQLNIDYVTHCSTQGGTDGAIQVTVMDSNGNSTGNPKYTYVIQALNSTTVLGLGSAGAILGASGQPVGSSLGDGTSYTWGFNVDLFQDASLFPQNTATAGSNVLSVVVGGNTNVLVPASTVNGTATTGLIAGCYRLYVYDQSVNAANSTTPCFASIDVCIQDGVGVIGCTDNSASTNFGTALNYNANAVLDDGSCQYCHASNGTLIDSLGNLIPTAGDIAVSGINSFLATPTQRTNSNDGSVVIQNVSPTLDFQAYINNIVNASGVVNVDFTLRLYKATSEVDYDNALGSLTPNDLTNFTAQAAAVNNNNMGWAYTYNTTTLGANMNYGYYAVQVAVSDPDAVVEIEQCFQVFYFVIPIEVCVDPSNNFATALTDTNTPPGTLVISDPRLWHSNPSICTVINNFCCDPVTLANPNQGLCNINQIVASFYCDPIPSFLSWDLEYNDNGTWTPLSAGTVVPTSNSHTVTYNQASTISVTTFVDDGNYRITHTSSYVGAADCTVTSAVITIGSPTYGCIDPVAQNYNSLATCDDGSCTYCIYGCMDSTATNYNPLATCDDGSCSAPVYGCTDPTASNYNSNATVDDGSCLYGIPGCTDTAAYNFNKNCANQTVTASIDDGCCFYPCDPTTQPAASTFVIIDATGTCGGSNADGSIAVTTFFDQGVMAGQTKTISYYTNSGVLIYTDPTTYSNANSPNHFNTWTYSLFLPGVYSFVISDNFGCQETVSFSIGSAAGNCGCTDPNAQNYDATAVLDDGSCLYDGCTDPNALNYNPNAATDDGSCIYPVVTNPCIPTYTNDLIDLLQACVAKNGFRYYNKLVTGQADDCSVLNTWKVILIEYLVSKRGNSCIFNCADSLTTGLATLSSCSSKWVTGGPATGINDAAYPGSSITTGQGTTITDPNLFFAQGTDLFTGDVIKMPSGLVYELVTVYGSCGYGCYSPESAQGARTGNWRQCVVHAQVTSFNNNINYLDKFNTFVTSFCVDCGIEDENVIKTPRIQNQNRSKRGGLSIDGINGLEI